MINKNRIVPVVKTDLLSLYGTAINLSFSFMGLDGCNVLSSDIEGNFSVTGSGDAGDFLCDQPVKTLDIPAAVTSCTVYFIAAYDFMGLTVAGAAPTFDGSHLDNDDVVADSATLYRSTFVNGTVSLVAVTPVSE